MEQPEGSEMLKLLKLPSLSEVITPSMLCRFDLCRLGTLTDPESAKPIRKHPKAVECRYDIRSPGIRHSWEAVQSES